MGDSFNGEDRKLLIETATKVSHIETEVEHLVSKDELKPIAWIVYAMAGSVLLAFLAGLLKIIGLGG